MDDNPETLDWIKRGVISATIGQKPYTMSFYGLKLLDDLHHNAVHEFRIGTRPQFRHCPPAWILGPRS